MDTFELQHGIHVDLASLIKRTTSQINVEITLEFLNFMNTFSCLLSIFYLTDLLRTKGSCFKIDHFERVVILNVLWMSNYR